MSDFMKNTDEVMDEEMQSISKEEMLNLNNNTVEVTDEDMPTVTPISKPELFNLNNKPSDNFNCFIATAAGLCGYNQITDFDAHANTHQIVRDVITLPSNRELVTGVSISTIKEFYKSIGIRFVREFASEDTLWDYLQNDLKSGDKKYYALAFIWKRECQYYKIAANSFPALCDGHVVSLKGDKTNAKKSVYRVTDHQQSACKTHPMNECYKTHYSKYMRLHYEDERRVFFSYAGSPFWLFEKN